MTGSPRARTEWTWACPLTAEQLPIIQFELVDIFKTRPRSDWVRVFMEADVCAVEHLRPTEVYDTPQARHNGMVVTVDDPILGPVEQVAPAAKLSVTPGVVRRPAPRVGQHTDEVLSTFSRMAEPSGPTVPSPVPDTTTAARWPTDRRRRQRTTRVPTPRGCWPTSGADVVKVEPLLGDPLRGIERPFFSAQAGKRALAANLKAARAAL